MVRTNEGGSVLSFAVVGVILAILMLGAVVAVRQQSINSQKPAPQKIAKTDDKKSPATTPAPSGDSTAPAPETTAPSSGSTTTPSAPAPQTQPSTGGAVVAPNKELPHTGPAETAMTVLAAGLLTASSVAYLQSRRLTRPVY